ncbi:MAG: hypothetical protein QOE68_1976 [Thermoanaerobaculia bacterium]|jgi:hypothetical protein|nr:hypothetical protein [Thermoanaerobaculia bacterium]
MKIARELRWFLGFFVLPMVAWISIDLAFSNSPLPLFKRLMTLEDTCSYGACFIVPAIVYVLALGVRIVVGARQVKTN